MLAGVILGAFAALALSTSTATAAAAAGAHAGPLGQARTLLQADPCACREACQVILGRNICYVAGSRQCPYAIPSFLQFGSAWKDCPLGGADAFGEGGASPEGGEAEGEGGETTFPEGPSGNVDCDEECLAYRAQLFKSGRRLQEGSESEKASEEAPAAPPSLQSPNQNPTVDADPCACREACHLEMGRNICYVTGGRQCPSAMPSHPRQPWGQAWRLCGEGEEEGKEDGGEITIPDGPDAEADGLGFRAQDIGEHRLQAAAAGAAEEEVGPSGHARDLLQANPCACKEQCQVVWFRNICYVAGSTYCPYARPSYFRWGQAWKDCPAGGAEADFLLD